MKTKIVNHDPRTQLLATALNGRAGTIPPEIPPSAVVTGAFGCPNPRLPTPTTCICMGTSASRCGLRFGHRLIQEFSRVPSGVVNLLCIDADHPPAGTHDIIHIGVDGAGTNPVMGLEMLMACPDTVCDAVTAKLMSLLRGEPGLSAEMSANEVTTVSLVAGCGGVSGGCLDPVIDLCHDVARKLGIRECRVQVFLIGPEISINDVNHSVTRRQKELILSTYAQNVEKLLAGFHERDGRVFGLTVLDQSSAVRTMPTTNGLTDMLGDLLFFYHCTPVGQHYLARLCDHRGCLAHDGPTE